MPFPLCIAFVPDSVLVRGGAEARLMLGMLLLSMFWEAMSGICDEDVHMFVPMW